MNMKRLLNQHAIRLKDRIKRIHLAEIETSTVYENMVVTKINYVVNTTGVQEICDTIINDLWNSKIEMRITYEIKEGVIFKGSRMPYTIKVISVVK